MPFKRTPQTFSAAINTMELGVGERAIQLGGENVLPFYSFDAPIANAPKIGVEISDLGVDTAIPGIAAFYDGAASVAECAKKACSMEGADFICLKLDSADPNGANKSVEDCAAFCKEVADAIDLPIVIEGCKNAEKDAALFEKVADALSDKNVLFLSAKEENYKAVGAAVGLAYGQKVGAESAVDINLAKQLNVLLTQLGVKGEGIAMNLGSAAAGYGFEYVASTLERVKAAALSQNDTSLQMPIITPVASEAWSVKEALVSEADMPEWGPAEQRGIDMEISTATAALAYGANAVILKHPESVATVSKLIRALL
jgi:acetyl-CoA decarbonylase/synthase complex subunit delta